MRSEYKNREGNSNSIHFKWTILSGIVLKGYSFNCPLLDQYAFFLMEEYGEGGIPDGSYAVVPTIMTIMDELTLSLSSSSSSLSLCDGDDCNDVDNADALKDKDSDSSIECLGESYKINITLTTFTGGCAIETGVNVSPGSIVSHQWIDILKRMIDMHPSNDVDFRSIIHVLSSFNK